MGNRKNLDILRAAMTLHREAEKGKADAEMVKTWRFRSWLLLCELDEKLAVAVGKSAKSRKSRLVGPALEIDGFGCTGGQASHDAGLNLQHGGAGAGGVVGVLDEGAKAFGGSPQCPGFAACLMKCNAQGNADSLTETKRVVAFNSHDFPLKANMVAGAVPA